MHDELTALDDPVERNEFLADLKLNTRKILEHARRADQIVHRLIEHADQAGGKRERIDLNKLISGGIETSVARFISRYQAEPAAIETDLHPGPLDAEVVTREMTKVVVNLLDNALYSVHKKCLQLEDFSGRITVHTRRDNSQLVVEVKDNGMGISDETRHRIFEPFFTTRQTGEGTGLGLYLCYQIILGHGGEMEFASEAGEWASFKVRIPRGTDS
jgi:signal transduction histidine kinase